LNEASAIGSRLNRAQNNNPSIERRLNIRKVVEIRRLIAKHPELANEFAPAIFGQSTILNDITEDEQAAARAAEAKARSEAIGVNRRILQDQGLHVAATWGDDQVQNDPRARAVYNRITTVKAGAARLEQLKNEKEAGGIIDEKLAEDIATESAPGLYSVSIAGYARAIDSGKTPAERVAAVDSYYNLQREKMYDQYRGLKGPAWVDSQFKQLDTLYELNRKIASGGEAADIAKNQLDFIKNSQEAGFHQKFPDAQELEFKSRMISNFGRVLGPTELAATVSSDSPTMARIAEIMAAQETGVQTPTLSRTRNTPQQVEANTDSTVAFLDMFGKKASLSTPQQREAVATVAVEALSGPDAQKSAAARDKVIQWMGTDTFKQVAKTEEFKAKLQGDEMLRAFEGHLGEVDGATKSVFADAPKGSVKIELDTKTGLLVARTTNTTRPGDQQKIARLSNRLQATMRAFANLQGIEYKQASELFYRRYLAGGKKAGGK
jgi:hypothetical protein